MGAVFPFLMFSWRVNLCYYSKQSSYLKHTDMMQRPRVGYNVHGGAQRCGGKKKKQEFVCCLNTGE